MNRQDAAALIAPCGMNCGRCRAFLRTRKPCPGCRGDDRGKPKTRTACPIKSCETRIREGADYCGGCAGFPCGPLLRLDRRYRANYATSPIANLGIIRASGIRSFVRAEGIRGRCRGCGNTLCIHKACCPVCRRPWRGSAAEDEPAADDFLSNGTAARSE